jgi:hypothetical protein
MATLLGIVFVLLSLVSFRRPSSPSPMFSTLDQGFWILFCCGFHKILGRREHFRKKYETCMRNIVQNNNGIGVYLAIDVMSY